MEYEYIFEGSEVNNLKTEPRELTGRQRNVIVIVRAVANDMDTNGTTAEQHTAALLRIVEDAIGRGYEAELVALTRAWRREVEAGQP